MYFNFFCRVLRLAKADHEVTGACYSIFVYFIIFNVFLDVSIMFSFAIEADN